MGIGDPQNMCTIFKRSINLHFVFFYTDFLNFPYIG